MGEEVARKHRQDVMQKYAIQVPSPEDYPLRQFEGKEGEVDAQIGYGKGSMVFHMLRQIVGKDFFFATLRNFAERYGGKQASWDDIRRIFEQKSGKRLDGFFAQWLDPLFSRLFTSLPSPVQLKDGILLVNGERVGEGDESLLLTYCCPFRFGKWVTIYFGGSAEALSRARYIFFYGWDSYIVFKKGRPEKRGHFSPPQILKYI